MNGLFQSWRANRHLEKGVREHDAQQVRAALMEGANPNLEIYHFQVMFYPHQWVAGPVAIDDGTACHYAIEHGDADVAHLLEAAGANLSRQDRWKLHTLDNEGAHGTE
jgi:hypothetical protein